jgi:hypothetical protein
MSARNDEIRLLLLAMLGENVPVDCALMEGLEASERSRLATMARQHRLEPLLHRNLGRNRHWTVPDSLKARWARAFRRSAMRALACERLLAEIAERLKAANIPCAALKGAWLAHHAYPHPALRPMRDIDILVSPDHANAAFDLLKDHGFVERNLSEPSIEHALAHGKHLPGLVSPKDTISIEIHHRLFAPNAARDSEVLATADVLSRCKQMEPGGIAYPTANDMLLHLIVHAVYEHRLCNGPLLLADVAFLLRKSEIAWDRLWQEADRGGWIDGCRLVFALVQHYHGVRVEMPLAMARPPTEVIRSAALILLQDHAQRGKIDLLAALGAEPGVFGKIKLVLRRARPRPHALAAFAGVPTTQRTPWLLYPGWLASRMRLAVKVLMKNEQRADMHRARLLKCWLKTEP